MVVESDRAARAQTWARGETIVMGGFVNCGHMEIRSIYLSTLVHYIPDNRNRLPAKHLNQHMYTKSMLVDVLIYW